MLEIVFLFFFVCVGGGGGGGKTLQPNNGPDYQ